MIKKWIYSIVLWMLSQWCAPIAAQESFSDNLLPPLSFVVEELVVNTPIDVTDILQLENKSWQIYTPKLHVQRGVLSSWIRIKITNRSNLLLYRLLEFENTMNSAQNILLASKEPLTGRLYQTHQDMEIAYLPASIFVPLTIAPGRDLWVYLNIKTSDFFPLEVFLWSNQEALQHIQYRSSLEGMEKGVIAALGVASLLLLFSTWSLTYLVYTLITLTLFVIYSATHGFFPYTFLGYPMPLLLIPVCLMMFAHFTQNLFQLQERSSSLHRLSQLAIVAAFVELVMYLTLSKRVPIELLILMNALPISLMIYIGGRCAQQKIDGALMYVLGWMTMVTTLFYVLYYSYSFGLGVSLIYNIIVIGSIMQLLWWKAALLKHLQSQRIQREKEQQQALDQQKHVQQTQEIALKAEEKANHQLERLILERTQKLEQTMMELNSANLKLEEQSTLDSLTCIKNKKAFDEYLYAEGLQSKRDKKPISLIMVDIDYFKGINDAYGHLAGDHVLKLITMAMKGILKRPKDFLARFGGEEFAVVLPNTDQAGSLHIAEQIRQSLEQLEIFWDGKRISVTASLGVTSTIVQQEDDIFRIIDIADQAMYGSKSAGRNQVMFKEYRTFEKK